MKSLPAIFGCFFCLFTLNIQSAYSDDTSYQDYGLSQISFDTGAVIHDLSLEEMKSIVEKKSEEPTKPAPQAIETPKQAIKKTAPAAKKQARAMLKNTSPEDISNLLIPSLKTNKSNSGPKTDKKSASVITTTTSWAANKEGSCAIASSKAHTSLKNKKAKANSLKELLSRLTGDDEFYSNQCSNSCLTKGHTEVPSALAVEDMHGGQFTIIKRSKRCHYQMSKKQENNWHVLKPVRIDCDCLPQ